MTEPIVSVVIPAYNAAATIGEALKALRAQAGAPQFELIVVDNGSTDATGAVSRSLGAAVLVETTRGPSAARNRGLRAARGSIVAHLDADTVPSRRWLREMLVPFSDPSVALVAGNTLCYPPSTPAERYVQASGLYDTLRAIRRTPFPFAPSLNLAVRREAALAVGAWPEDLSTGEDVDFSHRILRAYGTPIAYAERAVLYHRTRATDDALARQAWTYGEGAADLYRRYPDELRWDLAKSAHLAWMLASRVTLPVFARIAAAAGSGAGDRLEFFHYQSLWTRNFWLGFWAAYRTRRRRVWT